MYKSFNPSDHYWLRKSGKVYSSKYKVEVLAEDERYLHWLSEGNAPTAYPQDENGSESAKELQNVLDAYGLRAYAPTLEEAKAQKIEEINEETKAALDAGFMYDIGGKELFIAYDKDAPLDFADTVNMVNLSKNGVEGVPESVEWNGWELEIDKNGKEVSRTLVKLVLTSELFIGLYTQGAMVHKQTQKAIDTQRKGKVKAATTIEELEGI